MAGTPGHGKSGGRVKGTKNKRTIAKNSSLREYCESKGYDPVQAMINIATDPDQPLAIRLDCHKTVAKYIHPTLSAIEMGLDADTRKALVHRYGRK